MTTSGRGFVAMNMLPYGGGDGNEGHCSTPVPARKMLQSGWQSSTRGLSLLAPRLAVAALVVLSMSAVYFNGAMTLTGRHPPGATQDGTYSPAAIQEPSPRLQQRFHWPERPDLNGCRHVYIDVGSNMGVQIRKLFEPERYPEAEVHPIFDRFFGSDRSGVCAIGFEPHVRHTKWLKKEEAAYRAMGWRVTFLTETAASNEDNVGIPFFSDHNRDNPEAGASLVKWREDFTSKDYEAEMLVRTVDLAAFLMDDVANRFIPPTDDKDALPPSVVMKLDVEGSEWELVPFLMVRGALCKAVSIVFAEFHTWGPADKDWIAEPHGHHKVIFERFLRSDPMCRTELSFLDDESHSARLVKDHLSLPSPDGTFFGPLTHEEEMEEERLLKESDIKLALARQTLR